MQLWLRQNKIEYGENLTKPQVLEIIKRNKPEPIYDLLPYHYDLNPIELIWRTMKRNVASVNIDHKNDEISRLVIEAFEVISVHEWKQHCQHFRRLGEYLKQDSYLDEPFIINVTSDSATESDSDSDECGMEIEGVWPLNQDDVAHSSKTVFDHNYCKRDFQ
uniref:Tc1-like transposase DDE domain-containing protein n=1 Tax=Bombyx mori TaxID=7091 RepID=A0A8R2MA68_BOMMO|nr:uncharacterized protein LOC105841395 isoform X1 [Bombyx mori]